MQGSSNNSFIPKRRNSKRQRSKPGRQIFLVTIVAYTVLFASLLIAGGTLFYQNYTTTQLENEVVLLDGEINTFSVQDFSRVQEFDSALKQAQRRVDSTASMVAILDELDRVIAQPIQINDLQIIREGDSSLLMTLNFTTDTLDAALFQRKVLNLDSPLFSDVDISEVDLQTGVALVEEGAVDAGSGVTFIADFAVPLNSVLFDPAEARRTDFGQFTSNERALEFLSQPELDFTRDVTNEGLIDEVEEPAATNETAL